MLTRFAPRALTATVRSNAARYAPAIRTVTTDAASSHVDKSDVPSVCGSCELGTEFEPQLMPLQEDDKPFQVKISDEAFETYEMDPPSYTLDTTKKELKQMYYDMVAVR